MGGLLNELGKKLAERWLSLLVLPGVLYLATAATAHTLGHTHALDAHRLTRQITAWATAPAAKTAGGQVVLLAAVLTGAATAGLAAQGPAPSPNGSCWPPAGAPGPGRYAPSPDGGRQPQHPLGHRPSDLPPATRISRPSPGPRRTRRPRPPPERPPGHDPHRHRTPDRPTWSGDRINAAAIRLERDLHLNLLVVWPHLWLHLPGTVRAEITAARTALTRATTLTGWSLLYLPLTYWWWPAAPIAPSLTATARHHTRTATDTYATLLEAATRLHAGELARHLGIDHTGPSHPPWAMPSPTS